MARAAYVFIYLPGKATPVVAGRFTLNDEVSPPVGQFVYAQSYLGSEAALPLDPIALPLREQLFTTTLCVRILRCIPGRDSGRLGPSRGIPALWR